MPHGGGGGHGGGWGRGGPWGGGWGGDGWGGPPVDLLVPPAGVPLYGMDPSMMAAVGYQEIVGQVGYPEIVGQMPPPPPGQPYHHHEMHHPHPEYHHHHPHPDYQHQAGFLPDHEMGYAAPYGTGFLPDYEMGYEMGYMPGPYGTGFLPDYEMGLQPGEVLMLNDRRGLPLQGGYELGAVPGYAAGQSLIAAIEDVNRMARHEQRHDEHREHHDPRAWEDHAARRGWDRGHDWHHHDHPLPGGQPAPPMQGQPAPPMQGGPGRPQAPRMDSMKRWMAVHPGTSVQDYQNWWSQYGQYGAQIR